MCAYAVENARHWAYAIRLVSMCQMIVANRLITATNATFEPRLRLSFLNQARIAGSVRKMCLLA